MPSGLSSTADAFPGVTVRLRQRRNWTELKTFLRENGGPAGCADQFAAINPKAKYPGCIIYRCPDPTAFRFVLGRRCRLVDHSDWVRLALLVQAGVLRDPAGNLVFGTRFPPDPKKNLEKQRCTRKSFATREVLKGTDVPEAFCR